MSLLTKIARNRKIMNYLLKKRDQLSTLLAYTYKKTSWEPIIPENIGALRIFIDQVYIWKPDPLFQLLDHIQPIGYMNHQLETTGRIKGDCDDQGYYTGYMLLRMGIPEAFLISIPEAEHVILVFRYNDFWFFASNDYIDNVPYPTWQNACRGWCINHGLPTDAELYRKDIKI